MADAKVVDGLNGLLADSTVFYQKLRHYHWNVEGRHFFELHEKFEELYTKWADTIDEIAERILTVDATPLHTLKGMLEKASLKEDESIPAAPKMVDAIMGDLEALHASAGKVIEAAEAADDRGTANLLDEVNDGIEMDIWMLKAWKKQTGN
ncbi:MAG: Dps family protein [Gemmatimonadota bacterium]